MWRAVATIILEMKLFLDSLLNYFNICFWALHFSQNNFWTGFFPEFLIMRDDFLISRPTLSFHFFLSFSGGNCCDR